MEAQARFIWGKTASPSARSRAGPSAAIVPWSEGPPTGQSTDQLQLATADLSPCMANSEAALAWGDGPPYPARPTSFQSQASCTGNRPRASTVSAFQGNQLWADHCCLNALQYRLGRSQGFVGPSQMAVGLRVICDFCGIPWSQSWQQSGAV